MKIKNILTLYILDKITLKKISINDSNELFLLVKKNKEYLKQYLPWVDNIEKEEDEINFIKTRNQNFDDTFVIILNNNNQIIGCIDLHNYNEENKTIHIGYWIDKDFQGNGYITESCKKIIEYSFDTLKIQTIIIETDVINQKSINIAKKLNFILFKTENNHNFYKLDLYEWKKSYTQDKIEEFKNKEKENELKIRKEKEIFQTKQFKKEEKKEIKNQKNININNTLKLNDILNNKNIMNNLNNKIDNSTKQKLNKINKEIQKKKQLTKDTDSCVLMEGEIDFNDKTYSYKIWKENGQICFTISVIRNNKKSEENTIEFKETEQGKYEIADKTKTTDELGIFFKDNEKKTLFGHKKAYLELNKDNEEISLNLVNHKIKLNNFSELKKENNSYIMNVNFNNFKEKGLKNLIAKAVVKNMCERTEKTIYEKNDKSNFYKENKNNKENIRDR